MSFVGLRSFGQRPSAAEAGLIWVALCSAPFGFAQGRLLKAVPFPVKVKIRIEVNGNIKVKGDG
jgi:hypothetical protein